LASEQQAKDLLLNGRSLGELGAKAKTRLQSGSLTQFRRNVRLIVLKPK
jgi:hypothetical protein